MAPETPASKHENRVLWYSVFTVNPGSEDVPPEKKDRVILREFRHTVVDETNPKPYENDEDDILIAFPMKYLEEGKRFCECEWNYMVALNADHSLEKYTTEIPCDQTVFVCKEIHKDLGCSHYCTGALMKCPACVAGGASEDECFHTCRFCHGETAPDHEFDPATVTEMKCMHCGAVGPIGAACAKCSKTVAEYYCPTCKIMSNISLEAVSPHHCDQCGRCVVFGEYNGKHCEKCSRCFNTMAFPHHECIKEYGSCIICVDNLDDSIRPFRRLPCKNHYCHVACLQSFKQQPTYDKKCPLCKKPIEDNADEDSEGSDAED